MYDAFNLGFDRLNPVGAVYMTHIDSDDRLLPGALQFRCRNRLAGGDDCVTREVESIADARFGRIVIGPRATNRYSP